MYDKAISSHRSTTMTDDRKKTKLMEIPSSIQNDILVDRSKRKWEWIRNGLDNSIEGCSTAQAKKIYQLFDNLAIHFKERLLQDISEPRAIAFTISETNHPKYDELIELLHIARKAQILFTYTSSSKDLGKRETYFVPNRILWPERGLDPVGQHARVSIKAGILWAAANKNSKIPIKTEKDDAQRKLF